MNWKKWMVVLAGVALGSQSVLAAQGGIPFRVWNRLRIEYDDNYEEVDQNTRSSLKVANELELALNLNLRRTFVGFNVRPSLIWWENRPGDSVDFDVYANMILNHSFSRRASLSLRGTFKRSEAPELVEYGEVWRRSGDHYYGNIEGAYSLLVVPKLHMDLIGGVGMIRYSDSGMSDEHDYNKYRAGVRARYQIVPETELSGAFAMQEVDYESARSRDLSVMTGSVGLEHIFSPNLMASASLGAQRSKSKDSFSQTSTSPYTELGLTILPSPATRITLGGSYMITETDVFPYTKQQQMRGYASMSYDLTAALSVSVVGSYTRAEYEAENLPENARVGDLPRKEREALPEFIPLDAPLSQEFLNAISDRNEDIILFGTSLAYQMNRNNWLEIGWRHTTMDSDLREDFDRNVFHAGWRLQL